MKNLLILLLVLLPLNSISQSGYLGSKTNIQLNITNPFTPLKYKGKRVDETHYKNTNLNLNASFALTVNRVLTDEYQVGIGYRYTPMALFSNYVSIEMQDPDNPNIFQNTNAFIMKSSRVDHHSFVFNFRKFSNGISPIGKGWGIDLEYGRTNIDQINVDYVTHLTTVSEGIFNDKYLINEFSDNFIDSTTSLLGNSKANSFVIKGYIGRTIPVSKNIGIDLSMSIPILRILMYNNSTGIAYRSEEKTHLTNSTFQNNKAIAYAIKKYNGFSLNIGVKYFL